MNVEGIKSTYQSASVSFMRVPAWALSIVGFLSLLFLWFAVTDLTGLIPYRLLPTPQGVLNEFIRTFDLITYHLWVTLFEAVVGFTTAFSLAIVLALLLTLDLRVRDNVMPLIVAGNSVPRLAAAPIIIFYVGGGEFANYIISAWIAFFPLVVNSLEGMSIREETQELMLRSYEATRLQEIRYVRIPNALPHIFDGMKIGASTAIVGAIIGEFIAADQGIGYLLLLVLDAFQMDTAIALVFLMGVIGVVVVLLIYLIQDKVVFWREASMFGGGRE